MLFRCDKFNRLIELARLCIKNEALQWASSASKAAYSTTSQTVRPVSKRSFASGNMSSAFDQVPEVDIEGNGRFKYILIKVYDPSSTVEKSKYIVRGYNWAAYHADIYDQVDQKLQESGIESECVGGGRILHDVEKKSINVYGYSTGYGKADHAITTEILKKKYPDYANITWSNEGY